jgi:hypothetical protein
LESSTAEKFDYCPNSPGVFLGARYDQPAGKMQGVFFNFPCKSWNCPYCSPKKIKQVRHRVFKGPLLQDSEVPGFRTQYTQKFLTLTYPGADYRSRFTPSDALDQMSNAWNRLRTALKKKYGKFHYFKILEAQKDGYPHFHILLVGRSIADKEILQYIENLWRDHYKMGFVRLNVITNDLKHGIRYATKYLTKKENQKGRPNIRRYARLFTASRGALEPMPKRKKYDLMNKIVFGSATDHGFHEFEIDARPITQFIRDSLDQSLRKRICYDESNVIKLVIEKSNIRKVF